MSFVPSLLQNNSTQLKKQIHSQQIPQSKWIISKQILGKVAITVIDSNGNELYEKKNNIGDYTINYNQNLIELLFDLPIAGKCELILIENNITNNINKSLDSFKSSDLFFMVPYHADIISFSYKTTNNTYNGNLLKVNIPYNVLIHNINFSIYKINIVDFELAQNDIINIININNYNINYYNNFIINNTLTEIYNGQLNINKILPIFVEKTYFYIENNKIELPILLQ